MKRKIIPAIIAIVLIIVVAVLGLGSRIFERFTYSRESADLLSYFNVDEDTEIAIVLQDSLIEEKARLLDGVYYFDIDTVHKYFNERFYEDRNEGLLIYTIPDDSIRTSIGSQVVSGKAGEDTRDYVVARYEEDTLYVAVEYVKEYTNFSYFTFDNPGRMQVYTEWGDINIATVNKDTAVRIRGGIKSEILTNLAENDQVTVLEPMETWTKVKTEDGFIGYVENKRISEPVLKEQVPVTDYIEPIYESQVRDHKISLGFHVIAGVTGNDTLGEVTEQAGSGINTISPTWFKLNNNEGGFDSYATEAYVSEAHAMGLEVWALVENIQYREELNMYELLSSTSKREALINNLVSEVLTYDIDGINIDFEVIPKDVGEHFIQFIRELSIPCREHEIVLSIDNYVPYNYNDHYNRTEQGIVADYIIIMGYDEYNTESKEAGSVASIGYVENGIMKTVEQVPAEKVINAVPFYTRIWETQGSTVTSQAVGMDMAEEWVSNHQLVPVWDEETCQNYCEYTSDGVKHQAWLEDAESLEVKFNVMNRYGIGGVAFWRLGFEKAEVWETVGAYLSVAGE